MLDIRIIRDQPDEVKRALATVGVPHAAASITAIPHPSFVDVIA